MKTIIITGSRGRLATEIIKLNKDLGQLRFIGIDIDNADITDRSQLFEYVKKLYSENLIDCILHCAAWTAVDKAEKNKKDCFNINVNGTKNVVETARRFGIPLIYISTDYVFDGEKGNYNEEDIPNPINYYALTKLIGEFIVRQYSYKHIVIRTSFKPEKWSYLSAFNDSYSSADYTPIIAKEISFLLEHYDELYKTFACFRNQENIFHIGTERKSIWELAKRLNPNVVGVSKEAMDFKIPSDVSMDISKWKEFKKYIEKLYKNKSNTE